MDKHGWIFDLNPVLVDLGPVQIRYYGVVFACTLLIAFLFWSWQMRRGGHRKEVADSILVYGIIGTIVGARLGHCLFYEWDVYGKDPLRMLYFWEGGLASHGATIGILLSLIVFAIRWKLPYLELTDRFTFSAAIGAAGIRLGNFLNSEIVGRATDLPWAVRFIRYDGGAVARHPSQLYEFTIGLCVLGALLLTDRLAGGEKRPQGLLTGVFFTLYFLLRFSIEFVKEYQAPLIEDTVHHGLTLGQMLSVLPCLFGAALIVRAYVIWRKSKVPGL